MVDGLPSACTFDCVRNAKFLFVCVNVEFALAFLLQTTGCFRGRSFQRTVVLDKGRFRHKCFQINVFQTRVLSEKNVFR